MAEDQPPSAKPPTAASGKGSETSEGRKASSSAPPPPKKRSLVPPPRGGGPPSKAPPPPPQSGSGHGTTKGPPPSAPAPAEVEAEYDADEGLPASQPTPARHDQDAPASSPTKPPPPTEAAEPASTPLDVATRQRQKAQDLDPERLKDARMIAALYLSDDDLLPAFRRQRLGKRSRVSIEHLTMVRDLVAAVVDSLRVDDRHQWDRIRDAHELLFSRETMVPDPPTQVDDGWLNETPSEPTAHADRLIDPTAAPPRSGPTAAMWPTSAPASWGQAYAPGSLPAQDSEEMTPPRGVAQRAGRSTTPRFTSYADQGGYAVPPPRGTDPPTALMRDITQTLDPEAFDALVAARTSRDGAVPPPSERTHPHLASDDASYPPEAHRHASSRPPPLSSRDEDSATHLLSFTSKAHGLAMSVKEFAAYCAERDHEPDRVHAIARRYDMPDERVMAVVTRAFELRFARDPELRRRWQRAYEHFARALRQPS